MGLALEQWAHDRVAKWDANEHAIHKRPPFRAHSFDSNDRCWIIGVTGVSVLDWQGDLLGAVYGAEAVANALNAAAQALRDKITKEGDR